MSRKQLSAEAALKEVLDYISGRYGENMHEQKSGKDKRPPLDRPFTQAELKDLKRAIGGIQSDFDLTQLPERLENIAKSYFFMELIHETRPAQLRKELIELSAQALKLAKCFNEIHPNATELCASTDVSSILQSLPSGFEKSLNHIGVSALLTFAKESALLTSLAAAYAASETPDDKGGRPPENEPLRELVRHLASLYSEASGRKPTAVTNREGEKPSGRFFNFVKTYLELVNPRPFGYHSDDQLNAEIKTVLYR